MPDSVPEKRKKLVQMCCDAVSDKRPVHGYFGSIYRYYVLGKVGKGILRKRVEYHLS